MDVTIVDPRHKTEWMTRVYASIGRDTRDSDNLPYNYNFVLAGIIALIVVLAFVLVLVLSIIINDSFGWAFFPIVFTAVPLAIVKSIKARAHVFRSEEPGWDYLYGRQKPDNIWHNWLVDLDGCKDTLEGARDLCVGLWHDKAIESLQAVEETMWRLATLSRLPVGEPIKLICKQQVKDCNDLTETILSQCVDGATGGHADIVAREVASLIAALREVDEL